MTPPRSATRAGRGSIPIIAFAVAVLVGGCGADDDGGDASTASSPSSRPASSSPASSPTDEAPQTPEAPGDTGSAGQSPGSAPSARVPQQARALLRAARTAAQQVANSSVYSIERENDGDLWEVEVVTPDGAKYEMYLSGDGRKVTRPPRRDGGGAKYQQRIQGADLGYAAAVRAVLGEVPGARIDELNLDQERGTVVWEADVVDASGAARSVEIDAATGEVRKNQPDT